ncbi:MAG: 2-oxoglutarate dehydrogenase E1 component [Bacteroidetes bacterium]|nr:2-oxoglutarate dehydrogenase E1 component [Bacteroidota bacterium]
MSDFSFISNAHPAYIESLYQNFLENPESVEPGWRTFFQGFDYAQQDNGVPKTEKTTSGLISSKELKVRDLIHGYRNRGHLLSTTNPIKKRRDHKPYVDLKDFGLSEADMNDEFQAGRHAKLENIAKLHEVVAHMKRIYCGNIGFEYNHIQDSTKRNWLREKVESHHPENAYDLSSKKKQRILEKLNGAVIFERFLHTKYVGQKRFSLEGGESAVVGLDGIINKAVDCGVEEVIIGMAHRGRLNILANIMGKTYEQIFNEFEGTVVPDHSFGDGDVKYHLGFSSQVYTPDGKLVHLKMVPNPSHLESVDPIVEGFARAKADVLYNSDYDRILPILIHGDAAIAGQGVVYETIQMSQLEGYDTGGTIHLIINNQIGFTTNFDDARSSTYCTGAANVVQAPVFHINGDDPEAMLFAVELAVEYRQEFNDDVFIDMVCYRKHGHNEGDDPKFTQPEMYAIVNKHPDPREIYSQTLIDRGDLDKELAKKLEKSFWNQMQERLDEVKQKPLPYTYQESEEAWRKLKKKTVPEDFEKSYETGISRERIDKIINHLMTLPEGFVPLGKVNRLLKGKQKLLKANVLDWALAELLAFGAILLEGKDIRMSGQDVKRGTFSHRHAVFYDDKTYAPLNRLDNISDNQGKFRIYNSLLSEFGVMGFEYGYSLATPDTLVIWEAQFGDFYNGAQTIVDQYISAAERKWQRMSGLVLLLPHGYEGQGPEHSSGRIERFLQACAAYNMTVANVTTPANFFHILRRQLIRPFRKPLVVMSPKSLLRHPKCVSSTENFESNTAFQEVIDDPTVGTKSGKKIKRLLLCTGKVYYDLMAGKNEKDQKEVAIVRMEQLYPWPSKQLDAIFSKYSEAEVVWVQEESENMGAWRYVLSQLHGKKNIRVMSRIASASPGTGFKKVHDEQQQEIVRKALDLG